jgi:hypothetical protein
MTFCTETKQDISVFWIGLFGCILFPLGNLQSKDRALDSDEEIAALFS